MKKTGYAFKVTNTNDIWNTTKYSDVKYISVTWIEQLEKEFNYYLLQWWTQLGTICNELTTESRS